MTQSKNKVSFPTWRQPDGAPVSCTEKIKVLNENLEEIQQMAQDALEDGILMGCDEAQLREVLRQLLDSLENPYAGKAKDKGTGA
ncbi:MAG: hypothetical protein ACFCUQ_08880 [Kiloniellales bacterium]